MTNVNWGILAFVNNQYQTFHKNGDKFTPDIKDAMVFSTKEEAEKVAHTIKTPTLVQVLMGVEVEPKFTLPHPDFFESGDEFMTLTDFEQALKTQDKTTLFNPVDEINGGGQMTSRAIHDHFNGQLVGRAIQFSFSRLLRDKDIVTLREALARDERYESAGYNIHRFGCVAYAVLTLRIKRT